jgi:hypothetical protein
MSSSSQRIIQILRNTNVQKTNNNNNNNNNNKTTTTANYWRQVLLEKSIFVEV